MKVMCITNHWYMTYSDVQDIKPFNQGPAMLDVCTVVRNRLIDNQEFYQLLEHNRLNEYYQASCFVAVQEEEVSGTNFNNIMKKIFAIFICLLVALSAMSQRTDSVSKSNTPGNAPAKKDTAYVLMLLKTDTAKADGRKTVMYLAPDGYVKHMQGYPVNQGYIKAAPDGKSYEWVSPPQAIAAVDEHGKNIPRIISFADPYPPIPVKKEVPKPEAKKK